MFLSVPSPQEDEKVLLTFHCYIEDYPVVFSWCVISWFYFLWSMILGNYSLWSVTWRFCVTRAGLKLLTSIHDFTNLFSMFSRVASMVMRFLIRSLDLVFHDLIFISLSTLSSVRTGYSHIILLAYFYGSGKHPLHGNFPNLFTDHFIYNLIQLLVLFINGIFIYYYY